MNNTENEMAACSQDTQTQKTDDYFEMIKFLGHGSYGNVYLVRKVGGHDSGRLYALKQTKKDKIGEDKKIWERAALERTILAAVQGLPFLVSMQYAFETDDALNIVMDYACGGDLYNLWQDNICFEEDHTRIYIAEIVLALDELHKRSIVHSDFKLENILLDAAGHIVLTDFGFSRFIFPSRLSDNTTNLGGTCEYMAPEVVRNSAGQGFVSDWWSVGVVAFELLTGKSPFLPGGRFIRSQEHIYERILYSDPSFSKDISETAKSFIQSLLVKDPYTRLGARGTDEIKGHDFFSGVDWDSLRRKAVAPPFVPRIQHDLDVSNFADEFTSRPITEPLVVRPVMNGRRWFKDYDYKAPSTNPQQPAVQGRQPRRRLQWRAVARMRRRRLEMSKKMRLLKIRELNRCSESVDDDLAWTATPQERQSRTFHGLPLHERQDFTDSAVDVPLDLSISGSTTASNLPGQMQGDDMADDRLPLAAQASNGMLLEDVVGICDPLETTFSPGAYQTVMVEPVLLGQIEEEVDMKEI